MTRTKVLAGIAAVVAAALPVRAPAAVEVTRNDDEWRRVLPADSYAVLRHEATEPPFSSPLDTEKRAGLYRCRGCDLPLFSSTTKYDSGTGWPSFWSPLRDAVATKTDLSLLVPRTEVHCRRCAGHLGHVFDDGPKPTGLRYCMNGLALRFVPGRTAPAT